MAVHALLNTPAEARGRVNALEWRRKQPLAEAPAFEKPLAEVLEKLFKAAGVPSYAERQEALEKLFALAKESEEAKKAIEKKCAEMQNGNAWEKISASALLKLLKELESEKKFEEELKRNGGSVLSALMKMLSEFNPQERQRAADKLVAMAKKNPEERKEIAQQCMQLLCKGNDWARIKAVEVLRRIDAEEAEAMLKEVKEKDSNSQVKWEAELALQRFHCNKLERERRGRKPGEWC